MADVSKIKLTDNTEYDIKDAIARQSIATTDEKTTEIIEQLNNPTYTTTEGTDLSIDDTRVGKMKFEYYGDTEQETIGNLNRFNYTLSILKIRNASGTWSNNVYTNNSVTFTVNEDLTITVNGTASANTYFYLNASNDSYFKTLNGLTLKLTGTPTGGGNNTFQMTITSADWSNETNDNGNGGQFTAIEDFYNNTYIRIANGYNCSNLTFKPMLSTTLTTSYNDYEQPTAGNGSPSPSYPSEVKTVTGENTIDLFGTNVYNTYLENGGISGGTGQNEDLVGRIRSHDHISILEKTYTISCKETGFYTYVYCYDENKNYLGVVGSGWNGLPYTFIPKNNTKYIRFTVKKANDGAISPDEVTEVQINLGSTVLPYTLYKESQSYEINLGSLELCKIGNYQDYIYNNNGTWYKHSEIGKIILNGSENWSGGNSGTTSTNYTYFFSNKIDSTVAVGRFNAYCDTLNVLNDVILISTSVTADTISCANYGSQAIRVMLLTSRLSEQSTTAFKNWLSTHNVTLYYILATPIEEEITEPTLINQLNAIKYGAESYYGTTNIIITSEELQPVLKVQTMDKIV